MKKSSKSKNGIFVKICRNSFQFLEKEFGYKMINIEKDVYGTYLTYQNTTTAVKVSLEPREGGVFVRLICLVSGRVPSLSPIHVTPATPLHSFDLDGLITLRAPAIKIEQPLFEIFPPGGPNKVLLKKILAQYAEVLRQHASDVLRGDFRVFSKLEEIVKKRAEDLKKQ